jgi:hypothetical protein
MLIWTVVGLLGVLFAYVGGRMVGARARRRSFGVRLDLSGSPRALKELEVKRAHASASRKNQRIKSDVERANRARRAHLDADRVRCSYDRHRHADEAGEYG